MSKPAKRLNYSYYYGDLAKTDVADFVKSVRLMLETVDDAKFEDKPKHCDDLFAYLCSPGPFRVLKTQSPRFERFRLAVKDKMIELYQDRCVKRTTKLKFKKLDRELCFGIW